MTVLLHLLFGCSTPDTALTPTTAAALADRIATAPDAAESVLVEAGTDAATFEAYLYTVAADAEQTRQYLAARKR